MPRVTISKRTLDQLIRAKLDDISDCEGARPMPVAWRPRNGYGGCNWLLPGFTGDEGVVKRCRDRIERYLELLRSEFDIPDES